MEINKKQWIRPQLVILVKGTPEENVLSHCKRIGDFVSSAYKDAQTGCDQGRDKNCGACQSRSGS